MLTAQELITLIKAHNKLVSIKVNASMKREKLIKLIEDKGYKVDHKNKKIVDARKDRPRRPKITLKEAEDMLPKPKTALQKQKAQERKEKKAAEEKKKLRMAKKEAVEQSKKGDKKPVTKKPVAKKPVATKPKPKPVKSTTSSKEDEVRPARRARRQLPETKKTTGTKVEDKPENVKVKSRIMKLRQIDKSGKPIKEDKVSLDNLTDKVNEIIDSRGYKSLSKKQLEEMKNTIDYLKEESGKNINKFNIKESKGKTNMLILSLETGDSDQDRLLSIRVKSKK